MNLKLLVFPVLLFLVGFVNITTSAKDKGTRPDLSKPAADGHERLYLPDGKLVDIAPISSQR